MKTLIRFIWCFSILAFTFYVVFYYIDYKQWYDYISAFINGCVFIHYFQKVEIHLGV